MRPVVFSYLLSLGCTGAPTRVPADTGRQQGRVLTAVSPGAEVGLLPGSSEVLRVRYAGEETGPLSGEEVHFAIFGDPLGSTLSSNRATTDLNGLAEVTLSVGAATGEYEFRVRASAEGSAVDFFIAVSDAGFAYLEVRVVYHGQQSGGPLDTRVQLLSRDTCESIDPFDPPAGGRRKELADLASTARFESLLTQQPYALLATATGSAGILVSGCAQIVPGQLRIGLDSELVLNVDDVSPRVAGSYAVESDFSLLVEHPGARDLVAALEDASDCPFDPGQWILDAVLAHAPESVAAQIESFRASEVDGCFQDEDGPDALVLDLIASSDKAGLAASLTGAAERAEQVLSSLALSSTLTVEEGGTALHELRVARFASSSQVVTYELAGVPTVAVGTRVVSSVAGVSVDEHDFAIRLGGFARLAVSELAVGAPVESLATDLASDVGCGTLDFQLCAAASLSPGCLETACESGLLSLDDFLRSAANALNSDGKDFALTGNAQPVDLDTDGWAEQLSGGTWSAAVGAGASPLVTGSFGAESED